MGTRVSESPHRTPTRDRENVSPQRRKDREKDQNVNNGCVEDWGVGKDIFIFLVFSKCFIASMAAFYIKTKLV